MAVCFVQSANITKLLQNAVEHIEHILQDMTILNHANVRMNYKKRFRMNQISYRVHVTRTWGLELSTSTKRYWKTQKIVKHDQKSIDYRLIQFLLHHLKNFASVANTLKENTHEKQLPIADRLAISAITCFETLKQILNKPPGLDLPVNKAAIVMTELQGASHLKVSFRIASLGTKHSSQVLDHGIGWHQEHLQHHTLQIYCSSMGIFTAPTPSEGFQLNNWAGQDAKTVFSAWCTSQVNWPADN